MRHTTPQPDPDPAPPLRHRRVIVGGWGPVGRIVAEGLQAGNVEVVIVELNLKTIETQLGLDRRVVYGDIGDREVQIRAGITEADALIVTVPDEEAAIRACRIARELHPEIFIATRANFLSRGHLARDAGADVVVVEEVVTAQAMQRVVADQLLGNRGHDPAPRRR